jgi:hypothetical protein
VAEDNKEVIRLAGIGSALYAVFLIVEMVSYRLVGTNVLSDSFAPVLGQIAAHRYAFALSGVAGALSVGCLLPIALGLVYTLREKDRPLALLGVGFLVLAVGLTIVAYANYGNLYGTAIDYVHALAPQGTIAENGDILGDQFEITQYAAFFVYGVALLIFAALMSRSPQYQKHLVWLSVATGLAAWGYTVVPLPLALLTTARLAWALTLASMWLRDAEAEPVAEVETVLVDA